MRIEIEIPKEFEEQFKQDKFKNSLERIMVDIWNLLENKNCLCAGNYEYETIKMLEKALENSKSAYDVDKVVDELESSKGLACEGRCCSECVYSSICMEGEQSEKVTIDKAIEIVKAGSVLDD